MAGGNTRKPKVQAQKRKKKRPYMQFATGGAAAGSMTGGQASGTSMKDIRKGAW